MSVSLTTELRQAKGNNNEVVTEAYCISAPSVTYKVEPTASTDPFAGKTNKYAESKIVRITSLDKGCHVSFSSSGATATTSDYVVPANTTQDFIVDTNYAYVRLLQRASAAIVFVTEIY